jgi:hypothetical protein
MTLLQRKARLLQKLRSDTPTAAGYLRQNAGRHLIFSIGFWLLFFGSWLLGYHVAAFIVGGFWAGRLMRDIQWYRALAREWETTQEFIDWNKVDTLAATIPAHEFRLT